MAKAEIVAIGSELLLGQIVDTNSAWMAKRLSDLGIGLYYKTVVGDNPGRMKEAIERAMDRADVVITSGGLGPTQDDLTREVIAEATGRELVKDPDLIKQMHDRFRSRGFVMTPNNERQAYIPKDAITVHNPNGTAPSFIVEDPKSVIYALPGVPFEMKWLFDNEVSPYLRKKFDLSETITYRVLKVADMGESAVDNLIGELIANSANPTVGVLAHPGQVDIRIAARAPSIEDASKLIAQVEKKVRKLLGNHIFATDDQSMEGTVGELLQEKDWTISVYEDITGGLVSERFQQASPKHFLQGIVGNNEQSARRLLHYSQQPEDIDGLIGDHNRLSEELAWSIKHSTNSDIGLALCGFPDPDDASENLAGGKTMISITDGNTFKSRSYNSAGRGKPDRTRMSLNAIALLRLAIIEDSFSIPKTL